MKRDPIYGMMAEFDSAQALIDAAKHTHEAGYQKIDAYSPFPIEGLAEEIGFHHDEVPPVRPPTMPPISTTRGTSS